MLISCGFFLINSLMLMTATFTNWGDTILYVNVHLLGDVSDEPNFVGCTRCKGSNAIVVKYLYFLVSTSLTPCLSMSCQACK